MDNVRHALDPKNITEVPYIEMLLRLRALVFFSFFLAMQTRT